MSKIYGDVTYINSRSKNLSLELFETDPLFLPDEVGRLFFNINSSSIRVNNGSEWITVQFSNNSENPLIDSLGRNWLNPDLSFNPIPFNDFNNVNNLTSNDTLFSVLAQLDSAISTNSDIKFSTLSDVVLANPQAADVIIIGTDGTLTNINLNSLANERLNLSSDKLSDYDITDRRAGDIIKFSNDKNKFVNTKTYFEYTNTSNNEYYNVQHNLNQRYCFVQVINPQTNNSISNYSINFFDENNLIVSLSTPAPVKILVFGFNFN